MTFLKPGERIDDLQRSQLGIIQNPAHFCFGTDAVLLSGFVRAGGKERVVDLCTGNGIIPLLLSAKTRAKEITGVEIQAEIADMARRSVVSRRGCGFCTAIFERVLPVRAGVSMW